MRVEIKNTKKALKDIPTKQRKHIFKAIRLSLRQGLRIAKTLAPVDEGDLRAGIHTKVQIKRATMNEGGSITASIEAAPPDAESQVKALSVEFGRRYTRSRRYPRRTGAKFSGYTDPVKFMRGTQLIVARKHKSRIKSAMRKAAKEVGLA